MRLHGMAGHAIRRLHQLSTQVFAQEMRAQGLDLTSVQFAALEAIRTYPGIDQAGVAHCIAYDRATIGGVLDRLESKGHIRRSISARDRRAREVHLTDAGQAILEKALPIVLRVQDDLLPNLTQDERRQFVELAQKVLALDAPPGPGASSPMPKRPG